MDTVNTLTTKATNLLSEATLIKLEVRSEYMKDVEVRVEAYEPAVRQIPRPLPQLELELATIFILLLALDVVEKEVC